MTKNGRIKILEGTLLEYNMNGIMDQEKVLWNKGIGYSRLVLEG